LATEWRVDVRCDTRHQHPALAVVIRLPASVREGGCEMDLGDCHVRAARYTAKYGLKMTLQNLLRPIIAGRRV